ncbi:MAG: sigma 54-interacting transcriptional regulator, partial [Planctomycetota bacterium]
LQEGEVRPVGGRETVKIDVRLVTATNRNLEQMVREGSFREDLSYRLAVLRVHLPPLRDRKEDVPLLGQRFLAQLPRESGRVRVAPEAMERLVAYDWPGNVRELQNEVRRAAVLCDGVVLAAHLSPEVREGRRLTVGTPADDGTLPAERGTTLPDMVRELEVREIRKAFDRAQANKSRAAELLGLSRFALQRKLDKYALDAEGRPTGAPPAPDADG